MPVTMKDVAEKAGCSQQTVSLVMNGKGIGKIPDSTRARVKEIAGVLGYRPNVAAKCLRGNSARAIGVIQPALVIGCYDELARTVTGQLKSRGYQVYFAVQEEPSQIDGLIKDFIARDVDGVMLLQCKSETNPHDYRIPVLNVCEMNKTYELGVDLREGGRLAAKHLVETHGLKRIGFLGTNVNASNEMKLEGVKAALSEAGADYNPKLSLNLTHCEDFAERLRRIIVEEKAQAFICGNDHLAGKAIHYLRRHGVNVPEDIAIVGFDGLAFCDFTSPPLSTVKQPMGLLGRRAVELMMRKIEGKSGGEGPELIRPEFIPGPSCGCKRLERDIIYWDGTALTLEQLECVATKPMPDGFGMNRDFERWLNKDGRQ